MAETKDEIAAERDRLRAENENLRGQLAAAGARTPHVAAPPPFLSEGERQDLITFGVTTTRGGRPLNLHDAREQYPGAQLDQASAAAVLAADRDRDARRARPAVPHVDYVYPSVAPGELAPEAAGTPGISGAPAAAK